MANDISVVGSSYKQQLSTSYMLSIWISPDGLSFSVFDPVRNEYVRYGHFALSEPDTHYAKQEELMLTHDVFKFQYRQVVVSVATAEFTLVPRMLYDAHRADALLELTGHRPEKDSKMLSDELEMAGAVVVYALPSFLYFFLKVQFRNTKIMHSVTPLTAAILMKKDADSTKAVLSVDFRNGWMMMSAAEANVLKLCTACKCQDTNDYVYMVMNALEQTGLNGPDTKVVVSGDVMRNDPRVTLLSKFAHKVSLAQLPPYFDYAFGVDEPYRFVNLFNIPLCV